MKINIYDIVLYWTKYVMGNLYSKVSGTVNPWSLWSLRGNFTVSKCEWNKNWAILDYNFTRTQTQMCFR